MSIQQQWMELDKINKESSDATLSNSELASPSTDNLDEVVKPAGNSMSGSGPGSTKGTCPYCDSGAQRESRDTFVYAIGRVSHRFPNKSLEMELAQVIGQKPEGETKNLTLPEVVHKALKDQNNRYIARQICYVLNIEGLETYILVPRDPLDIDMLIQAIRPAPAPGDIDVIIGRRGSIAPPQMCNGLIVPIITVDQIYSFDRDALIKSIPKRRGASEEQFKKTASAVFDRIIQLADNTGATDEHRAVNYLLVRYDEIYHRTQALQEDNYSFIGIEVLPSHLSGARKVVDVIFSYENRTNRSPQKWFVRVDVTGEFPFLVSPMQEYFEH